MAEYIKLEDTIAIIKEKQKELCPVGRYGRGYVYGSDREKYDAWEEIIDALEDARAVDVAPVVRCENCTSGIISDDNKYIICCRLGVGMEFDDFCSHGERKNGDSGHAVN